jgi:hypothetical protein
MDMLDKIYQELIADEYIKAQAYGRIKFYEYPANGDVTGPYIVIDPLSPPLPSDYGDNAPISDEYLYQVDVWTKDRKITKVLAKKVQAAMRSLGYGIYGGGVDEYDKDTGIFRDARRYKGKDYLI